MCENRAVLTDDTQLSPKISLHAALQQLDIQNGGGRGRKDFGLRVEIKNI